MTAPLSPAPAHGTSTGGNFTGTTTQMTCGAVNPETDRACVLADGHSGDHQVADGRWFHLPPTRETPEEVVVEGVARALEESCVVHGRCTWTQLATAALAALRGDRAPLAGQHTTDEEGLTQ